MHPVFHTSWLPVYAFQAKLSIIYPENDNFELKMTARINYMTFFHVYCVNKSLTKVII